MKRVYETVAVEGADAGFAVTLDGNGMRTPAGTPLVVPSRAMADAIADEWSRQGETVEPWTMPFTRLANAVIDGVVARKDSVVESLTRYGGSDLLCYRAEEPEELAARQAAHWEPLLDWVRERFGIQLRVGKGLNPVDQPESALEKLRSVFQNCDPYTLASAHTAASISGSAVIALALVHDRLDLDAAWSASRVDEDWQIEKWGEDAEAAVRDMRRKREMAVSVEAIRFMREPEPSPERRTA